ncbi:MAG: fused DSP-PTPase phosphatase/NAD kinase-like protein [Acidimicrobiales bacterium]
MTRIPRRPLQILGLVTGAWLGVFVTVNATITLAGFGARWAGKDPRLHDESWPSIRHLRLVDDGLLVGGQTTTEEYRGLVEHGVTLVIDVRTGSPADATEDDRDALADLGLDYVALPIPDGRAPTPEQIRRFLDLVEGAEGRVFAHCGGGVGRSTSLAAAYEAAHGQDPSVLAQIATGPPTIEQIWFAATLRPNDPEHGISPAVAVASRVVDMPRTLYGWARSLVT